MAALKKDHKEQWNPEDDVARATKAWLGQDSALEASEKQEKESRASPDGLLTPQLMQNGNPLQILHKALPMLANFWTTHGDRVKALWAALDDKVKASILNAAVIAMPEYPGSEDSAVSLIAPEMNVRDLIRPSGPGSLPSIYEDLFDCDVGRIMFIDQQHIERCAFDRASLSGTRELNWNPMHPAFVFVQGEQLGQSMSWTPPLHGRLRDEPQVKTLFGMGGVIEKPLYDIMMMRRVNCIVQPLVSLADEFLTDVFGSNSTFKLSRTSMVCSGCQRDSRADAPSRPVKMCSGCKQAAYCSTKCQKAHWQKHKKFCRASSAKDAADKTAKATGGCAGAPTSTDVDH